MRPALRAGLLGFSNPDNAFDGLSGPLFFGSRSGGALPTLIGRYEGRSIVAAETQLSPIRDEGVTNYLEQLTAGKALYVNDRFMYKTNVVSAGIRIAKILEPNLDANIAEVEFRLWFRWRGNLPASDIVFENAVTPISLGAPERNALFPAERAGFLEPERQFLGFRRLASGERLALRCVDGCGSSLP